MVELVLQKLLIARLNQLPGVWVWRQNTGMARAGGRMVRFGLPGQADISGLIRGTRLEVECKSPTGRLTTEQRAFGDRVAKLGGIYIVARCETDEPADAVVSRVLAAVQG
jgi:hypothetical protein